MRRIFPLILKLAVVAMAVSLVGDQVRATKGDVERALDLIRQARAAIGGDAAVNSVQSLTMNGKSRRQIQLPDQTLRDLNGDIEINMLLPDRFIRIEKLKMLDGPGGTEAAPSTSDKKEIESKVRIVRNVNSERGDKSDIGAMHDRSEIARYMMGLLLKAPADMNVAYDYAGVGDVDGVRAEIIDVQGPNGFSMKLYLSSQNHLPLMMTYKGFDHPTPIFKVGAPGTASAEDRQTDVIIMRGDKVEAAGSEAPRVIFKRDGGGQAGPGENRTFTVRVPAPKDLVEIQVRFSDYRAVNGVLLPFAISETVNGKLKETWTVDAYVVNSPDINRKFDTNNLIWRMKESDESN